MMLSKRAAFVLVTVWATMCATAVYLVAQRAALPSIPAGTIPGTRSTYGCGDKLWVHVYHPSRLLVYADCVTISGVLVDATAGKRRDGVRQESDGDVHGWLRLDPAYRLLLNSGNRSAQGGNLVYEVVCTHPIQQRDAVASCVLPFRNVIVIPPPGSHVTMRGSLVRDTRHQQWNEVHPVSSIKVIP